MNVKDIVYSVCNEQGISLGQAARNIGISRGSLWNQLDRNGGMNVKISTLVRYLSELGCEIYISNMETEEEFLLDGEDDDVRLARSENSEKW